MGKKISKNQSRKRLRNKHKEGALCPDLPRFLTSTWWMLKRPSLLYVSKLVLLSGILALVSQLFILNCKIDVFSEFIAKLAHGILKVLGEQCYRDNCKLLSYQFSVAVVPECSGLVFVPVVIAATLLFPTTGWQRVIGAVAATLLLLSINLLRVVSLYVMGIHYPKLFPGLHELIWPPLMPLVSILIILGWIAWMTSRQSKLSHDAQHE